MRTASGGGVGRLPRSQPALGGPVSADGQTGMGDAASLDQPRRPGQLSHPDSLFVLVCLIFGVCGEIADAGRRRGGACGLEA